MKSGLDYFPLDTSLDSKFELLEAEFGLTGFAVVVKLLQRIYGGFGYYCEYTTEVALLFARKLGLGGNVVSEIVSASIRRGIFDKEMYDKYRILTSVGIQKRFFEAVKRRKNFKVEERYLLISCAFLGKNVDKNCENDADLPQNADNFEQSREEESREEESRGEYEEKTPSGRFNNVFLSAYERMKLSDEFGESLAEKYIDKLSVWISASGKNVKNHYATVIKWISEDRELGKLKEEHESFDVDEFYLKALNRSYQEG